MSQYSNVIRSYDMTSTAMSSDHRAQVTPHKVPSHTGITLVCEHLKDLQGTCDQN